MPSTERLLKAVVLATPAMEMPLLKAVDLQREGATDPQQHGKTPPTFLPKREVVRFLERIAEYDKAKEERRVREEERLTGARRRAVARREERRVERAREQAGKHG